jgi:hypothetical protein
MNSTHRERVQQIAHILAGVLILLKSRIVGEHHPAIGTILIILGITFILVALFHHRIERVIGLKGESFLFLLEALAVSVVAYEMTAEHKHYLQYAYALAAVMYVIAAIMFPLRHRSHQQS